MRASIADQAGHRPGYVRQWFHAKDPQNRAYFERYRRPQQVGNSDIGYCMAAPWTVVHKDDAKPGRKRDDDTVGIESALTHGDLVCMETPEENFRIYQEEERLKDVAQARRLGKGDDEVIRDESGKAVARYRARVGNADEYGGDHQRLLKEGV